MERIIAAADIPPATSRTHSSRPDNVSQIENPLEGRNEPGRATMEVMRCSASVEASAPEAAGARATVADEDAQLVRSAARGDGRAFHALVDRHGARLFRLAVSLCGSAADAEDIVQETLTGAYRGLSRFEGRSTVKTWLSRILVTQAARLRRARRTTLSLHDSPAENHADAEPTASATVQWSMDLQAAMAKLSPEHRVVVILREIEGLAYEEIAEVLRVPRGTVESRLHRARGELRRHLKAYAP